MADYERLLTEARRMSAERDAGDRASDFAAPGDVGILNHLDTAAMAIKAGITIDDFETVAEGQAMLLDAIDSLRNRTGEKTQ